MYWYNSGGTVTRVGGSYAMDGSASDGVYSGPLAFVVFQGLTFSHEIIGSSGTGEYSSMSSQVPTTNYAWVSDITFESNYPYSLHPTAVNGDINVGDMYWYLDGVSHSFAGGSYFDYPAYCGPLSFSVNEPLMFSDVWLGSSGTGEYSSMSSQVPAANNTSISDIAFESNYPYSLHPTAVNGDINVGDMYWYTSGVRLSIAGGSYFYDSACSGPFTFAVDGPLTYSYVFLGSLVGIQQQPMTI